MICAALGPDAVRYLEIAFRPGIQVIEMVSMYEIVRGSAIDRPIAAGFVVVNLHWQSITVLAIGPRPCLRYS